MDYPVIARTTKCIVCLKLAICHSGFVRWNDEDILAGWCEKHKKTRTMDLMNEVGCCGGWHKCYGYKKK